MQGISETVKKETTEQKGWFLSMFLETLAYYSYLQKSLPVTFPCFHAKSL